MDAEAAALVDAAEEHGDDPRAVAARPEASAHLAESRLGRGLPATILGPPPLVRQEIEDEAPLFGEGLGLDSIDVLELVIMMEKDYQLTIDNKELGAQVFGTLRSMARFIQGNLEEAAN